MSNYTFKDSSYLRNIWILLASFWFLPASCTFGQSNGRASEPLEIVVRSMEWVDVLDFSHDIEITVHTGQSSSTGSDLDIFSDVVIKVRRFYNQRTGEFFVPSTIGGTSIRLGLGNDAPDEVRSLVVRYGGKDWIKESSRPHRIVNFEPCPNHRETCLEAATPVDFLRLGALTQAGWSPAVPEDRNTTILMERLEKLEVSRLELTEQKENSKKQLVYWITGTPAPRSAGIPCNKMVVSNEGHDKGLLLEFHSAGMELTEKEKYNSQSKLLKRSNRKTTFQWKEFDVAIGGKEKQKVVLPVSISKKEYNSPVTSYTHVTFDWKSFDTPKAEQMNLQFCEKLCDEYDAAINKVLNR